MKIRKALKTITAVALLITIPLALPNCLTQPEEATRILSASGYTGIEITGWRPFAAGKDDTFSTGFRAVAPNGTIVTGAVTSGLFKGHTIRLD